MRAGQRPAIPMAMAPTRPANANSTKWPSKREPAQIDNGAIKVQRDEMTKLGRRATEHGGTVDLEISAVVDEPVRGPLRHYSAVLEVIGQRGLRRTGRRAAHVTHHDPADRIPESLVRLSTAGVIRLV